MERVKFFNKLKQLFLALPNRSCKFIFFNLIEGKPIIVVSNGDTDLLAQHSYTLSVHIFTVQQEVYDKITNWFGVEVNTPYVFNLVMINKVICDALKKKEEIKPVYDPLGNMVMTIDTDTRELVSIANDYTNDDDEDDNDDRKERSKYIVDDDEVLMLTEATPLLLDDMKFMGMKFTDQISLLILQNVVNNVLDTVQTIDKYETYKIDISSLVPFRNNLIVLDLQKQDNIPWKFKYILQNGADIPSVKGFVRKATSDYEFQFLLYKDTGNFVKFISIINNEDMNIISARPNFCLSPIANIKHYNTEKTKELSNE